MKTNAFDRQNPLAVVVDLGPAHIGTGNEVLAKLPQGALVTGVLPMTATAFNAGGTDPAVTLTVADGIDTLVDDQDVKTVGKKTVALGEKFYPAGGTLTFSLAESAESGLVGSTEGRVVVVVHYVQLGAGAEIYG